MIFATAGHVDHGKTSLLKALTGQDADRLPEEKARGLTIDLGFIYDDGLVPGQVVGFVDVPGHQRFLRNMLAGVSGVGAALLVIAADDGVMPQTVEHLEILTRAAVPGGCVVLTKVDRVSAARLAELRAGLAEVLAGSCLDGAPVFEVSSVTGAGVEALAGHLREIAGTARAPEARGRFRLAPDRAFTVAGAGLVVTGMVQSGAVEVGESLVLQPGGQLLRVRGMHVMGRKAGRAQQGQRAALNLAGEAGPGDVPRGSWIVAPGVELSRRVDVEVRISEGAGPLRRDTPVHVHLGAADIPARLFLLDRAEGEPGGPALAQLTLDRPVCAAAGDVAILRDQSARRVLGGARVVDPEGLRRGRARPERLAWLGAMALPRREALAALLAQRPGGVPLGALDRAWNHTEGEAAALRAQVPVVAGGVGFSAEHAAALGARICDVLADFHAGQPERAGPDVRALRAAMPVQVEPAALEALLEGLRAEGRLGRRGPLWHLAEHAPKVRPEDARLWAEARPLLEAEGRPPVISELATRLEADPARLGEALARLSGFGVVVKVTPNRYLTPATLRRLAGLVAGGATAAEFRDRSGVGRNLSIELLEWFDRQGLTRREGRRRRLLKDPEAAFGPGGDVEEDRNPVVRAGFKPVGAR